MTGVMVGGRPMSYAGNVPIPIGGLSSRAASSEPSEMLRECHDRIRQHMRGAIALGTVAAGDPAIAPTAAALHRYFSVALPLHSQDEDESVGPRLAATGLPRVIARAVADMTAQHADIDAVLARLVPAWLRLSRDPSALDQCREALVRDTLQLDALWAVHLDLEERVIFPLIPVRLDAGTRAAIAVEMRQRRVPLQSHRATE